MPAPIWAGMLLTVLLCAAPASAAAPQKVMSLNLCADVLLLHLAEREQIASLTFLAASSPLSPVQDLARDMPRNHGTVEEVIAADPDLVLVHRYSNTALRQVLKDLGYELWRVDAPPTVEEAARQIESLAGHLGHMQRGRMLANQLRALPKRPVSKDARIVAVYGPNGMTSGPGSLLHDLIERSGLRNFAAVHDLPATGRIPLELLLSSPPQALVFSGEKDRRVDTLAQQTFQHPALRKLAADIPTVRVPGRYWSCGGPELIEAHARLQALRHD